MKILSTENKKIKYDIPEQSEFANICKFYENRLLAHGYQCRDHVSFKKISAYFARYYFVIAHELPGKKHLRFEPPAKGLLIYGACGAGKTLAMQIFSKIFKIRMIYADELTEWFLKYQEAGFWEKIRDLNHSHIIIDDLGSERDIKVYGNDFVMGDLITKRERLFRESGIKTFITTNTLSSKDIAAKYGERIASRILGMNEPVLINAKDARKEI